jgi:hypothetical protein
MAKKTKLIIFVALFLLLTLTPLVIMLVKANWALPIRDFSVALAFFGMAIAGMQFLPISRIPWFSEVGELDMMSRSPVWYLLCCSAGRFAPPRIMVTDTV